MKKPFTAKTWKQGNSIVVAIPAYFVKFHGIKAGNYHKFAIETEPSTPLVEEAQNGRSQSRNNRKADA